MNLILSIIVTILSTTHGYMVTKPAYQRVQHGWSVHHVQSQFDNTGKVKHKWTRHGVRHMSKLYHGVDAFLPHQQVPMDIHIFYRHTSSGWHEYKKSCHPWYHTSLWRCK